MWLARVDADLRRFYQLTIDELVDMNAARAMGLLESLPEEAAIYRNDAGYSLPTVLAAKQIEVTHELIRVLMALNGIKRRQLPKPLNLLGSGAPAADPKSKDPRAWAAAMGAAVVRVG